MDILDARIIKSMSHQVDLRSYIDVKTYDGAVRPEELTNAMNNVKVYTGVVLADSNADSSKADSFQLRRTVRGERYTGNVTAVWSRDRSIMEYITIEVGALGSFNAIVTGELTDENLEMIAREHIDEFVKLRTAPTDDNLEELIEIGANIYIYSDLDSYVFAELNNKLAVAKLAYASPLNVDVAVKGLKECLAVEDDSKLIYESNQRTLGSSNTSNSRVDNRYAEECSALDQMINKYKTQYIDSPDNISGTITGIKELIRPYRDNAEFQKLLGQLVMEGLLGQQSSSKNESYFK